MHHLCVLVPSLDLPHYRHQPSMKRAVTMRSSWTCRQCLAQLSATAKKPSRQAATRWKSTQPAGRNALKPVTTSRGERRSASFFGGAEPQKSKGQEEPYVSPIGTPSAEEGRILLRPDNLFHPLSNSPSPAMRRRAAYMKQHAYCPHPSHQRTRMATAPDDPESRKPEPGIAAAPPVHVKFECPDCGVPTYCCEEHWMDDYEAHLEVCQTLQQINTDDHDLRSGRFFPEFEYPGPQRAEEFLINMSNWDTFLYTRDFNAIDDERSMRQVTRLLTYPATVSTILHEFSPYSVRQGGRLTNEGLRSFAALRYQLHPTPQGGDETVAGLRPSPPPIRIFVLGARAESSLPREVWLQITHCFPRAKFHLIFVGPESMANREDEFPLPPRTPGNPFGGVVEDRLTSSMKITTFVEYYHTLHQAGYFAPYDPYFDVFVLFHPGLGHPASSHEWAETLPMLLETKCPIISTGYTDWDMERDRRWVEDQARGEYDVLLEPGENIFRSLRWDLNDLDPTDVSCGNWGVWSFRGKRYEAKTVGGDSDG